jgi:hypothetical protein
MEGFLSLPPPLSIPEAERRQGIERADSATDRRGPACFTRPLARRGEQQHFAVAIFGNGVVPDGTTDQANCGVVNALGATRKATNDL